MSTVQKRPYAEVFPIARAIVKKLAVHCDRIEIAGSLRRGRPLVGDIEIVALPRLQQNLFGDAAGGKTQLDAFLAAKGVQFHKNGERFKQFGYGAFTVDLFLPAGRAHWGSIFTIRTGSAAFSKWLVDEAAGWAGVKFKGGRLYRGGHVLDTPEEADVFEALGLPFVPPQHRDDDKWRQYVPQEVTHA